jgi:transposase InsO family protein
MAMIWLSVKREFFIEFPFKSNNLEILLLTHIKGWGDYRKTYASRAKAREDIFDYIEMFYDQRKSPWDNPVRRHGYNNGLSPVVYEKQYQARLGSV